MSQHSPIVFVETNGAPLASALHEALATFSKRERTGWLSIELHGSTQGIYTVAGRCTEDAELQPGPKEAFDREVADASAYARGFIDAWQFMFGSRRSP